MIAAARLASASILHGTSVTPGQAPWVVYAHDPWRSATVRWSRRIACWPRGTTPG